VASENPDVNPFTLYMNRFLLLALATLIVFCSCQKDVSEDLSDPTSPTTPTTPTAATLTISRSAIAVGTSSGYTDTFTIQSTIDWTITLSAGASGWLSLDTMKGGNGSTIVKLSVIANATTSQTATITVSPVKNSTVSPQVITITQDTYSLLWQKAFGGSYANDIMQVIEAPDGGLVFAGKGDNAWVLKTDANGNKVWEFTTTATKGVDHFFSITTAPDGGYVATGYIYNTTIYGAITTCDVLVVKLDASGAKVWEKRYGGSANESGDKIVTTADGGYIIAGHTSSNDGDVSGNHGGPYDIWVLKLDGSGNKVWAKTYGGTQDEFLSAITATADGNYIVAGSTGSNDGDVSGSHGSEDVWVLKIDASGNKIWSKTYGGSQYEGSYAVQSTKDGGSIIAGYTDSNDGDVSGNHSSDEDMWVIKLDNNGQKTWQSTLGGTNMEEAYSVAEVADGGYMICGFAFSNDGDITGNHGDKDFWVVKVSGTGKKLWQKSFGGPGTDWASSIITTKDGGFVTAGFSTANGGDVTGISGWSKGWVVKFK